MLSLSFWGYNNQYPVLEIKNATYVEVVNGSFRASAKSIQSDFYKDGVCWDAAVVKTAKPYAVTIFENSPLNRVQQQGAPGMPWQPAANRDNVTTSTNSGRTFAEIG